MEPDRILYTFGPFRVDPAERLLTRDGAIVPTSPKVFDTLLVFVRSGGRLLEKEALMRSIWPNTFVDETNLAQSVSLLRKALDEHPGGPRYIETVPKHGYRFIADVREVPAPSDQGGREFASLSKRRRSLVATVGSLGLAGLVGLTLAPRFGRAPDRAPSQQLTQLTNFTDSATSPVLSPDGRMLAFIRDENAFLSDGQIWAMTLPNGDPVQVTHESLPISTPAFAPDGFHVAYTVTDVRRTAWDTRIVPVLGGPARSLLTNASGLTWMDDDHILFSEIKDGMHMGVVVAKADRSEARDVYLPAHQRTMAHYSYVSPDRRWVLVAEMDPAWRRCRLVPFDGSSLGEAVGPDGACRSAAWSPDGRWMYFGATVNGEPHLWRQRFPDGTPEQITSGPTEEEGIAMFPDGRSLVTALGFRQAAIWIHSADGDRAISSQGDASRPSFSADGQKVYYLLRPHRSSPMTELWVFDRVSGASEPLITGRSISSYDISPDEREVVVAAESPGGASEVWVARLGRGAALTRVAGPGETPFFGPKGGIVFKATDGHRNYLFTTGPERSGRTKLSALEISNIFSHSPDGQWVLALAPNAEGVPAATILAFPVQGGSPVRVCAGGCLTNWSPDGRLFQIAFHPAATTEQTPTFVVPLEAGRTLPPLPPSGFQSEEEVLALPGVWRFEAAGTTHMLDAATYAYVKPIVHRNLYRLPLP